MKLSFIIPTYMGKKFIPQFIASLEKQTDQNFDAIFIVDASKDSMAIDYLLKMKLKYKNTIKVLFNSKRQKRLVSIISGIKLSSAEYITICSTKDSINDNFVENIDKIAAKHNPDVIEYKFKYKKAKIEPKLLTPKNKLINLAKDHSIIANFIPFDFNKVIKKSLAKKSLKDTYMDGESRFDCSFILNVMMAAKSYYAINRVLKTTNVFHNSLISYRRMTQSIKNDIQIMELSKNNDLFNAVLYYGWTALSIYQMQVLMIAKKPQVIKNLYAALERMKNTASYKHAHLHNDYFLQDTLSAKLINHFPNNIKTYKKQIMKREK